MLKDYLHTCRFLHADVKEMLYGSKQDLTQIERQMRRVRLSHRLTYDDVETIKRSEIWDASAFGYWPPRTEIESLLESKKWNLWDLPKQEDQALHQLLEVFCQIEPVSVILRFVMPEDYGIMSPPVEKILGLGPFQNHVDRYRAYLENLRKLRDQRQFKTAAEVDMALWTLQTGIVEGRLQDHVYYKTLFQAFKEDTRLRDIQVDNLTRELLENTERIELAEAMVKIDSHLAGLIGSAEFEKSIKRLLNIKPGDRRKLSEMIPDLNEHPAGSDAWFISDCIRANRIRNLSVHRDPKPPSKSEVSDLVKITKEVIKKIPG